MRVFDYRKLKSRSWDNEIVSLIAQIHEHKGRQEAYLQQAPQELDRLVEIAKVQSTEASNRSRASAPPVPVSSSSVQIRPRPATGMKMKSWGIGMC